MNIIKMKDNFTEYDIVRFVKLLIGNITPVGITEKDDVALENKLKLDSVVISLITEIYLSSVHNNSFEYSMARDTIETNRILQYLKDFCSELLEEMEERYEKVKKED